MPSTLSNSLKWVPALALVALVLTCSVTYPLSIALGHVKVGRDGQSWVPFISATLNHPPESCIGGLGLFLASVLMCITMAVKHVSLVEKQVSRKVVTVSRLALAFGFGSSIGLIGVASFQFANLKVPHLVFASLLFLCGAIHLGMMVWIDSKTARSRAYLVSRRILGICFIAFAIPTSFAIWGKGTTLQTIGAACEISTFLVWLLYLLTYSFEFDDLKVSIEASMKSNGGGEDPLLPGP